VHAESCKKILSKSFIKGKSLTVSWATSETREFTQDAMEKVTTLFVNNVSAFITEDILKTLFAQFGEVAKCVIIKHAHTGEPRGFAFVEYADRDACINALDGLDSEEFFGQQLSVALAKPPPTQPKTRLSAPQRGQKRGASSGRGGGGGSGRHAPSGQVSNTGTVVAMNSITGETIHLDAHQFGLLKQQQQQTALFQQPSDWSPATSWNHQVVQWPPNQSMHSLGNNEWGQY